MPRKRTYPDRDLTVEIDGVTYTGRLKFQDVGGGKVAFELAYAGEYCGDHNSIYDGPDDPVMLAFARIELKRLVELSRGRKKPAS